MQLNSEHIRVTGTVVAATSPGVLVNITEIGGDEAPFGCEFWFPKRQMKTKANLKNVARGDQISFDLPSWIALERGFFDDGKTCLS